MNRGSFILEDRVKKIGDWKSFTILYPYFKAHQKDYFKAIFFFLANAVFVVFSSTLLGVFIDKVVSTHKWQDGWVYILLFFTAEILAVVGTWGGEKYLANAGTASILDIRKKMFSHIHQLPVRYYDRQPEGRTVTRITQDVENIEGFFSHSLTYLLMAFFRFLIVLGVMLIANWRLGIFLSLAILPAVYIIIKFKNYARILMREMSKSNSACNASLAENLRGMGVIRSFSLQKWVDAKYEQELHRYIQSIIAANSFFSWSRPLISLATYLPLILLLILGGQMVLDNTLTIGVFIAFTRYCEKLSMPIARISREINTIQQAFTSLERVVQFLNEDTEDSLFKGNGRVIRPIKGEIEFKNVVMGYDHNNPVLHDVSFRISAGEKVGIVGKTGSGKTTIISLLVRLYPFQHGEILIDGIPIDQWNREWLRSQIGFVSQDVTLFKGTLRDNLLLGNRLTDQEIMHVCHQSRFAQIMLEKKMNLDSLVLERGSNFSVGERQLLAFTRVLLGDTPIVILDEATANIDPKYENFLQKALLEGTENKTLLVIAHRLNTLDICNRLFRFSQGKLITIENIGNSTN